jgi:hypothetical protein
VTDFTARAGTPWHWYVDFPGLAADQAEQLALLAQQELGLEGSAAGTALDPRDWCALFMDEDTAQAVLVALMERKTSTNDDDLDSIIEHIQDWIRFSRTMD